MSAASETVVGLDLGGTRIKAVLMNRVGTILQREIRQTQDDPAANHKPGPWASAMRDLALDWTASAGREVPIGISAPGLVRDDGRAIGWMPGRLAGLEHLDWTEWLGRSTPVPVLNDAHAALYGEAWIGAARGLSHVVMLTLGTGVGGAAMSEGRILRGRLGRAGHFGHMSLDFRSQDRSCTGMPGALEYLIGNYTVSERSGGRFASTQALLDALAHRDSLAISVWQESIQALACGLASLINLFDPEAAIVGGGIAEAGDALFTPLRALMPSLEWCPTGAPVPIIPASLGEWAGAVGAARLALDHVH